MIYSIPQTYMKNIFSLRSKAWVSVGLSALMLSLSLSSTALVQAQDAETDSKEPADVENVVATPGDAEAKLDWDDATDNVGVTGYKIYRGTKSVKSPDEPYDLPVISTGSASEYTVKNLTNDQTYYFTVTALDAAGNESASYAKEVSATPQAGLTLGAQAAPLADDGKNPQVKSVISEDAITVVIVFSEAIKLAEEAPEDGFTIENAADKSRLEVQNAVIDPRDASGATVLLTTAPQAAAADYIVTAGIEVKDQTDNPVVSGTSDTGSFKGSARQHALTAETPTETDTPAEDEDTRAPTLVSALADFNTKISVVFSEKITLSSNPKTQFKVREKATKAVLLLSAVSLSVDGTTAYLTTVKQKPTEYEVIVNAVADLAGNIIENDSTIAATGKGAFLQDTIPPDEVTKLIARVKDAQRSIVELRWEGSRNTDNDLHDQLLYQGEGKNTEAFGGSTNLGSTTNAVEVQDLKPGTWYTFKISTKDYTGNESQGAFASVYLPQTGPGAVAAGLTSLFAGLYRRRKKKIVESRK